MENPTENPTENPAENPAMDCLKILLKSALLTVALMGSLALITFWASKRGYDFSILNLILIGPCFAYFICIFLQLCLAMGKHAKMIIGCFGSILYCGYTIYVTDELIKGHENIWVIISATIMLFFYIAGLFTAWVNIFIAAES